VITRAQFLYFAVRALNGMTGIVEGLGDDLANRRPDLPGANSPYALLTHCLGVVDYWSGVLVAGHADGRGRDRDAEFTASGPVAPLVARARSAVDQLRRDVDAAVPRKALRDVPPPDFLGPDLELDQGGALLHVFEELAQHHGQMEVLRDAIVAESLQAERRRR
jgi:hypothetical protein